MRLSDATNTYSRANIAEKGQGTVCMFKERDVLEEPKRSFDVPIASVMNTTS